MDNNWDINFANRVYKTFNELVSIKSDTGTVLEKDIEEYLYQYIRNLNYFQRNEELYGIYKLEDDFLKRAVVWGLVKGKGEDTVILMHHHDAVDIYDYGSLSVYATNPEKLQEALNEVQLSSKVTEDLKSGEWIFGRGTADMKAGAAIQLELLKEYSEKKEFNGNLLLLSVPDEESLSIGMRNSVSLLEELRKKFNLNFKLLINSEPHSREAKDTGILYEGSVGKLMPVVYVRGKKTHIGNIFEGFNPVSLLAEIARKTELNTRFCDVVGNEISPPPSWAYFKDRKEVYDASIPPSAGGYFSILSLYRTPKESLELLKEICEDAFVDVIQDMNKYYKSYTEKAYIEYIDLPWKVNVKAFSEIYEEAVKDSGDDFIQEYNKTLDKVNNDIRNGITSLQESSFIIMEKVLEFINDLSPIVVIAFSPPYYPAVANINLKNIPREISKLSEGISDFSEVNWEEKYEKRNYFMGISDMSYTALNNGEEVIPYIENNMPLWGKGYSIPLKEIEELSMPGINIGPWGEDIHKFTERVRKKDLLEVCPKLIAYAIDQVLSKEEMLNFYDENENYIGKAPRSEVHTKGLWHKTFQCWIVKREDQDYYVLFQKRHPKKDTSPNLYDISSAGHLEQDESIEDGTRELKEELGIDVMFEELIPLGRLKGIINHKNCTDKEICLLYLYKSNRPLDEYVLQAEELTSLVKINIYDVIKLFHGELEEVLAEGIEYDEGGQSYSVKKYLKINNFVLHGKEYYHYVFNKMKEIITKG